MSSWNFPGNQDGQIKGVADAGIENFINVRSNQLATLKEYNAKLGI